MKKPGTPYIVMVRSLVRGKVGLETNAKTLGGLNKARIVARHKNLTGSVSFIAVDPYWEVKGRGGEGVNLPLEKSWEKKKGGEKASVKGCGQHL